MEYDGTTNSQITDSVTQANTTGVGQAPAGSQGLLDVAMAESVGIGMYNAVAAQHYSQMINGAAVAATCARLLQPSRESGPSASTKPSPPISPLEPPPPRPPGDPASVIQQAQAAENKLLTQLDSAVQGNEQLLEKVKTMFEKIAGSGSGGDSEQDDDSANDDTSGKPPASPGG